MQCSLKEVLEIGKKKNIAIGAFNCPNSESLFAVIEAAEELDVPVIISHAQLHEDVAPIDMFGPVMVAAAKASKAKICVHLDHGEDFDYCKRAIEIGFSSVMIDCSTKPYEENISTTRKVVDFAHAHGVDVEAELGALPNREDENSDEKQNKNDMYTKVELVPDFINRTKIDALAIAFGTAHGIYKVKPVLNFDIISNVRKISDIPLVMHGGSGIGDNQYREVIKHGINKINYYTYMAVDGYNAAKDFIEKHDSALYHELAYAAKEKMKQNIIRTIKVFSGYEQ